MSIKTNNGQWKKKRVNERFLLQATGLVFNIQRYSIQDGPGIRTTVFLKGCSMQCFWCHNPEGRKKRPELFYFPEKCISCGECVVVCPNQAHIFQNDKHVFIRENCKGAGNCVDVCYSGALDMAGREMSVDAVMEEILKDRIFYDTSGGGVTLSGGEPVLQFEFSLALLKQCKKEAIHTTIETCGNYSWKLLQLMLPYIDLVMMDIKHIDAEKHQLSTGYTNRLILENARRLALTDQLILFRTPVVPDFNDSPEELTQISGFILELVNLRSNSGNWRTGSTGIQLELLPFHRLAADKYRSLGMDYRAKDYHTPDSLKMEELYRIVEEAGLEVIKK